MIRKISILGCGWLGLPLGRALLDAGYTVLGSTTRADRLPLLQNQGIQAFQFRLDTPIPLSFLETDLLILTVPPDRNDREKYPAQIAGLIRQFTVKGPKFLLYTSSTGIYPSTGRVDESTAPAPSRPGAKAVWAAEKELQAWQPDRLTILRLAGLVGGNRTPARYLAGKTGLSGATQPVNLVHRTDVIRAVHQIIEQALWGSVFNICADTHPARADYYIEQAQKMGWEVPEFVNSGSEKEPGKWVDNAQFKARANFRYQYPDPLNFPLDGEGV